MAYVMIVDDDEDFASAAATALCHDGHEVFIETDAATALDSMADRPPDLVILDVMFPENAHAGFELAQEIRRYGDPLRHVPVLMLTAVNSRFPLGFSSSDIDEDYLPVNDFLEKPVDLKLLCKRIDGLLQAAI